MRLRSAELPQAKHQAMLDAVIERSEMTEGVHSSSSKRLRISLCISTILSTTSWT